MESTIYAEDAVNVGKTERVLSVIGGVSALVAALMTGKRSSIPLALFGGYFVYRGVSGNCLSYRLLGINRAAGADAGVRVERAVTINRPVEDVYRFWRQFENLPRFMENVESVTTQGSRSHWVVKAPLGVQVEWDAEITQERENELIAWRTLPGAQVEHGGRVEFRPAPGGRGTELYVQLEYDPPAGSAGAAVAKLLGKDPNAQVREDVRRFKALLEAGEIPTTEGQPSGRAAKEEQR